MFYIFMDCQHNSQTAENRARPSAPSAATKNCLCRGSISVFVAVLQLCGSRGCSARQGTAVTGSCRTMSDKPAWLPSSAQPQSSPFMPAQPDGSAPAPLQPPWQRKPSTAPAWLPQLASAPGSASQTPRWQSAGTPIAQQPGLPAMSPRGWPPSQQQQPGQQQHWQGGDAQRSEPASPRPAWPPYQAQQQPAPMQWQGPGQAQSAEQSALPSPRPAWQPSAPAPQTHQQQAQADMVTFDPSPRASHAQQPWQPQSSFQPAPLQHQRPSWGSQEQQYAPQENGAWNAHGDQPHGSTAPMRNVRESEQLQAATTMDNGNHGQMDWQQNEQWDAEPEQVSNPPTHPHTLQAVRPNTLNRCLHCFARCLEMVPLADAGHGPQ